MEYLLIYLLVLCYSALSGVTCLLVDSRPRFHPLWYVFKSANQQHMNEVIYIVNNYMYIACFADSVIFRIARGLEYNFDGTDFVGCKIKFQMMLSQNKDCLQINDSLLCM